MSRLHILRSLRQGKSTGIVYFVTAGNSVQDQQ